MTVITTRFFRTEDKMVVTPRRRAKLAGELLWACAELESRFEGEVSGWRVVVDRVTVQRAMVAEDIGLAEATP